MKSTDKGAPLAEHRQALRELEQLCSTLRTLVLATSLGDQPHCSLMSFAFGEDKRSFVLVTPKGTRKYENIQGNGRASTLLTEAGGSEPQEAGGLTATINGHIAVLRQEERLRAVDGFVRKYPRLREFAESPDSAVLRLAWEEAVLVRGIHSVIRLDLAREGLAEGRNSP